MPFGKLAPAGLAAGLWLTVAVCCPATAAPQRPDIRTEDVTRFFQIYDAASGHPGADQLDRDYLAPGTAGLHEFAQLRRVTGARIAETNEKTPQVYTGARRCLTALPGVKQRLTVAFGKLARLYPEAKFPPVTLLVGRGRPVGITNPSGVSIGLEALCAADFMDPDIEDRFVHNIAHEYGHIQQSPETQALEVGMPGATLLRVALIEGAAEFTAELISGAVGNYQLKAWTRGHEAAIDAAFVADRDKTDVSAWLNNGPGTPDKPGDLAYWVGHRIVKSYYDRAPDKHQALREIFDIRDPKAFMAKSGWRPAT
ncbi:DUF2268 domain-containing putative Zn-dependent protease [Phenylobacterium sp.]|jgi:hypothetical protein|uniref:DUF2268 domain-containing putative Zn-dependent protease n=1 Tax=Phenylobacterium sp. TaxID=1871053 RepID=UPI002E31052E|nr:DUF2268 domain-containing putative Zn-dependent protease [Phenylobacterium sp.]HEX3364444.1 DUF2268 domain-containing putative Zn-dependent protease [Phenylobacterium sp.]